MTRLPVALIACVLLAGCGFDGPSGDRSGDSATRTERSATEPGVAISGYARVGVMGKL